MTPPDTNSNPWLPLFKMDDGCEVSMFSNGTLSWNEGSGPFLIFNESETLRFLQWIDNRPSLRSIPVTSPLPPSETPTPKEEVWELMDSMFEQPAHLVLNKLQPLATRLQRDLTSALARAERAEEERDEATAQNTRNLELISEQRKKIDLFRFDAATLGARLAEVERERDEALAMLPLSTNRTRDEARAMLGPVSRAARWQTVAEGLAPKVRQLIAAHDDLFAQCCSNPITNAWGKEISVALLNEAAEGAEAALASFTLAAEEGK